MSRIGKLPVNMPANIKAELKGNEMVVTNGKKSLCLKIPSAVKVAVNGSVITVEKANETKQARASHGTVRALVNNMVNGLTQGFSKKMELVGIGYKAQVTSGSLVMNLGLSHQVMYPIPEDISITVEANTKLTIQGADKQKVGQTAAEIRKFRKPEPYKGKGIKYEGEVINMKDGKRSK